MDVGTECPFNSKLAIFKAVMGSFLPLGDALVIDDDDRGVVILMEGWIKRKLRDHGVELGEPVPDVRAELNRSFTPPMNGAADPQMATALRHLGQRLVEHACGATSTPMDDSLISWVRGDKITSTNLKSIGLFEPANDENAFNRLNTTLKFLRQRLGYRGFFIAFDEGSRAMSFRRGSIKQRQVVENLLDFINKTGDQQFSGVMFLYAANDEFRSELIAKYEALDNRIGNVAMTAGSPMVPFIDLDAANTPELLDQLGDRLMDVFETARGISLDRAIQGSNFEALKVAYERENLRLSPRTYVGPIGLCVTFAPVQCRPRCCHTNEVA